MKVGNQDESKGRLRVISHVIESSECGIVIGLAIATSGRHNAPLFTAAAVVFGERAALNNKGKVKIFQESDMLACMHLSLPSCLDHGAFQSFLSHHHCLYLYFCFHLHTLLRSDDESDRLSHTF